MSPSNRTDTDDEQTDREQRVARMAFFGAIADAAGDRDLDDVQKWAGSRLVDERDAAVDTGDR